MKPRHMARMLPGLAALSLLFFFFGAATRALADEKDADIDSKALEKAIGEAEKELAGLRRKAAGQGGRTARARKDLLKKVIACDRQAEGIEEQIAKEAARIAGLEVEVEDIQEETNRQKAANKAFWQRLQSASGDLGQRLEATLVGITRPEMAKRARDFSAKLKGESSPSDMAQTAQTLIDLALGEIDQGSQAGWFMGEIVDPDGNLAGARIFRVGEVAAFCVLSDGRKGIVVRCEDGLRWRAIVRSPGLLGGDAISRMVDGLDHPTEGIVAVPFDVSGGLAISKLELDRDLWEILEAGGFVMWPLAAVAFLGVFIAVERALVLAVVHMRSSRVMQKVEAALGRKDFVEAEGICRRNRGPVGRVLFAGLTHRQDPKDIVEDVLSETIIHEGPVLERFLSTLGVLAMIAPLLGLLGTVTGMISTFQMISAHGSGDPRLMSGGISEALITTQAGLIIAVPLLLLHAFFSGRVNHLLEHLDANATRLVTLLFSGRNGKTEAGDAEAIADARLSSAGEVEARGGGVSR